MINAIKHRKINIEICEDSLTSSILGTMLHLPTCLFWQIFRQACYEKDNLPYHSGEIINLDFWPSWSAERDDISNSQNVEPDVFIELEGFNLIIEAKRYDIGGQYKQQWINEINSFYNEYGAEKDLYFIALGGCSDMGIEYIFSKSHNSIGINKCIWTLLLKETWLVNNSIERQLYNDGQRFQLLRILKDVIEAFAQHGILYTQWLCEIDSANLNIDNKSTDIFRCYER